MHKTIQNENTGVIHVAYGVNHPITHCGAVDSYSENIWVQRYDTRALRNKAVTCKNCIKMLGLPDGRKPKKAKWVANYLGDTKPLGIFDDVEFEMSVCREDYTEGREAAGWPVRDLNKKIIIFDSDDYIIDTIEELKWMKQVVEATAHGMNEKGL